MMLRRVTHPTLSAVLAVVALSAWGIPQAQGGIISTSGQVQVIAPPPSVVTGALENNSFLRVFAEQQGLTLPVPLAVDLTAPGTYTSPAALTPGTIAPGTAVDSFLLHFDQVGTAPTAYGGSVTFDTDILGILLLDATVRTSDALVGAPGTTYPTVPGTLFGTGLELRPDEDVMTLSADRRTLTLNGVVLNVLDHARVVTVASPGVVIIPEPSSLTLLGLGFLVIAGYWRWRQAAQACRRRAAQAPANVV